MLNPSYNYLPSNSFFSNGTKDLEIFKIHSIPETKSCKDNKVSKQIKYAPIICWWFEIWI